MKKLAAIAVLGSAVVLGACSPAPRETGINDPYEAGNRKVHAFNRGLDQAIVRPVANAYGTATPSPARRAVSNVAETLGLPATIMNDLLQFNIGDAGANTFRFLINATFGLAGTIDVATEAGIAENSSNFGETLYTWGAKEGAYVELPVLGPNTVRSTTGLVVDLITNPLNSVFSGTDRAAVTGAGVLAKVDDRYEARELIDEVLYESEDSYSQTRLLYLQNRRFKLTGEENLDLTDFYDDIYGTE
ncbi:MAG: VacJ family lipoprotein [Litoreibacter sp.]|nr:VacJ family lipoprotein [Litoreibacter sp.]MCY4333542.1 VacJ family lipoprotein [Litoreibacter sp.]